MSFSGSILGVFFALMSAFLLGSGDFSGGYATRRNSQFYVLVVSAISGFIILFLATLISRENFPSFTNIVLSMLAGASGAFGIAALYRALSIGNSAVIAPTSAVIGAGLPVIFSGLTEGLPAPIKLFGFVFAFVGIWIVSKNPNVVDLVTSRRAFFLACFAGLGFGGVYIFLGLIEPGKIFTPLVIARFLTVCTGLLLIKFNNLPYSGIRLNHSAFLAGILDAGGGLFYILAKQYTRLDIAAVLSSLYPVATIFFARVILREKVSFSQWIGVGICLIAIILITI